MIWLQLLWWFGLAWFAAWTALPLLLLPTLGPVCGFVAWALLAPWSALLGMGAIHRMLPASPSGRFTLLADQGSVFWALKGWAPSLYLTVFQSVCFQSEAFQRIALRVFEAEVGPDTVITSRTIIREPHHIRIGAGTLVGEYAHLICSYQPRPKLLIVGRIVLGDHSLVGAHCFLGPGVRIASDCILGYAVHVGAHSSIGTGTRIGAETTLFNSVRIGARVSIGKRCVIHPGTTIPDGASIPDGTTLPARG